MNSYIGDDGQLVIYTDRWDGSTWQSFAKDSEAELRAELVQL